MGSGLVLAALARRLNREAGNPPIPALYFFTDPVRTPDPMRRRNGCRAAQPWCIAISASAIAPPSRMVSPVCAAPGD